MHLKRGDFVKLLPVWQYPETAESPIWGGVHGYHIGVVTKIHTGDHDKNLHTAEVEWAPGRTKTFPEAALGYVGPDDEKIANGFRDNSLPDKDVWVLIRTSSGRFSLNVLEARPFGRVAGTVAGITRFALNTYQNSDYNLVNHMLSAPDYHEVKAGTLYNAAHTVNTEWGLPEPRSVFMPLQRFDSIMKAAESAPSGPRPAVLYFTIPHNLVDFADSSIMAR